MKQVQRNTTRKRITLEHAVVRLRRFHDEWQQLNTAHTPDRIATACRETEGGQREARQLARAEKRLHKQQECVRRLIAETDTTIATAAAI